MQVSPCEELSTSTLSIVIASKENEITIVNALLTNTIIVILRFDRNKLKSAVLLIQAITFSIMTLLSCMVDR